MLVFDQYMNVYQTGGEWRMTQGFARYVQEDMGQPLQYCYLFMGESFQDYSRIQEFKADFP